MTEQQITREAWLTQLGNELLETIAAMRPIPAWKVSCGVLRASVAGKIYCRSLSQGDHFEIVISAGEANAQVVAATLAHELIHAVVGIDAGHGAEFRKVALAIGLTTPMTRTPTTSAFWDWVDPILAKLGPYPHSALILPSQRLRSNRGLRIICKECGCKITMSMDWYVTVGVPTCACGGAMHAPGFWAFPPGSAGRRADS